MTRGGTNLNANGKRARGSDSGYEGGYKTPTSKTAKIWGDVKSKQEERVAHHLREIETTVVPHVRELGWFEHTITTPKSEQSQTTLDRYNVENWQRFLDSAVAWTDVGSIAWRVVRAYMQASQEAQARRPRTARRQQQVGLQLNRESIETVFNVFKHAITKKSAAGAIAVRLLNRASGVADQMMMSKYGQAGTFSENFDKWFARERGIGQQTIPAGGRSESEYMDKTKRRQAEVNKITGPLERIYKTATAEGNFGALIKAMAMRDMPEMTLLLPRIDPQKLKELGYEISPRELEYGVDSRLVDPRGAGVSDRFVGRVATRLLQHGASTVSLLSSLGAIPDASLAQNAKATVAATAAQAGLLGLVGTPSHTRPLSERSYVHTNRRDAELTKRALVEASGPQLDALVDATRNEHGLLKIGGVVTYRIDEFTES